MCVSYSWFLVINSGRPTNQNSVRDGVWPSLIDSFFRQVAVSELYTRLSPLTTQPLCTSQITLFELSHTVKLLRVKLRLDHETSDRCTVNWTRYFFKANIMASHFRPRNSKIRVRTDSHQALILSPHLCIFSLLSMCVKQSVLCKSIPTILFYSF